MNNQGKQFILFFAVLLSRIPFLFAGYGVEEDSWGHVLHAAILNDTGVYEVSRLPGHPLLEGLLLISWNSHSAMLYNLFSALASAGATVVFYRVLLIQKSKFALAWSIAFSLIPVVFISSTYTIDYIISLFFILLSYEAVLNQKMERASLWLAAAVGFRITALAMLLPLSYYVLRDKSSFNSISLRLRQVGKLITIAILVSALFYLPAYFTYGIHFFDFHRPPYPDLLEAIYKMSIGGWGVLGIVAIGLGKTFIIQKGGFKLKNVHFTTLLLLSSIYGIAYFRMPEKAAFWLPVVPFLMFFFAQQLKPIQAKVVIALFMISPFLFGINKTDAYTGSRYSNLALTFGSSNGQLFLDPIQGPLFNDYTKRLNKLEACQQIEKKLIKLQEPTLVIAGWWYAMLEVNRIDGKWNNEKIKLVYFASPEELIAYEQRGFQLRYLPELGKINDQKYRSNYTVLNATLMPIE